MRAHGGCRPMFDTIILLTGLAERDALTALLQRHNPRLTVQAAETLADLEAIAPALLPRARLLGFVTPVVVPRRILERLGFGAYNFHPGPPDYPGWVPAHFAVYEEAKRFGATVHVMAAKVDAGPIVAVERFAIPPATGVLELEQLAYVALARLLWRLAPALATQSEPLPALPVPWGGRKTSRKLYRALCDMPPDIGKDELERRLRAFGAGHFGIHPTVTLHGRRFRYEPVAKVDVAGPSLVPASSSESETV
jgi:methionyl-tRNA formyltransferase